MERTDAGKQKSPAGWTRGLDDVDGMRLDKTNTPLTSLTGGFELRGRSALDFHIQLGADMRSTNQTFACLGIGRIASALPGLEDAFEKLFFPAGKNGFRHIAAENTDPGNIAHNSSSPSSRFRCQTMRFERHLPPRTFPQAPRLDSVSGSPRPHHKVPPLKPGMMGPLRSSLLPFSASLPQLSRKTRGRGTRHFSGVSPKGTP